jgi:hypothetical protein
MLPQFSKLQRYAFELTQPISSVKMVFHDVLRQTFVKNVDSVKLVTFQYVFLGVLANERR